MISRLDQRQPRSSNMRSSSIVLVLIFFGLCIGSVGQQPVPSPSPRSNDETVRISSSLIQLDVVVTDKNGTPVMDLRPEDFRIYQDGKLQTITALSYINSRTAEKAEIFASKKKVDRALAPPPPITHTSRGRIITFVLDDGNC